MRGRSNTTVNTHTRRTKHTIGRSRRRPTNVTKKTHKKTQPSFFERKKKDAKVTNEGHEEATMARKKRNGEEEEEATEIAKKKKWRK